MKIFKDVINIASTTLGYVFLGNAIARTFSGDYKTATILLFVVAGLFIVGYHIERFTK